MKKRVTFSKVEEVLCSWVPILGPAISGLCGMPTALLPECLDCTHENGPNGKHLMLLNEKEHQLSCYVDDVYEDEAVQE